MTSAESFLATLQGHASGSDCFYPSDPHYAEAMLAYHAECAETTFATGLYVFPDGSRVHVSRASLTAFPAPQLGAHPADYGAILRQACDLPSSVEEAGK